MATQVTFKNQPGLLQDYNKPVPDYITDLQGKRYPLTSIDAAYAMANVTCQTLGIGVQLNNFLKSPQYAAAPDELKGAAQAVKLSLASVQAQNFVCLAMLFRFYSLRPGFQTDYMKAHDWRLDRIWAPDQTGAWTLYNIATTDDWVRVAELITKDVLRQTKTNQPSITLTKQGVTMSGMSGMGIVGINLLAPVVLEGAAASTAAAATTGAVTQATAAGVAAGGGISTAASILAQFAWPITVCVVGVVGVYKLGNVTTYAIDKGAALVQERGAAEAVRSQQAVDELTKASEDYRNAKTDEEKQNALARFRMWDQRVDKNAEQSGGLGNALFGGSFDFQKIAYTVIGLGALYAGLQLFLKNRPASSSGD